MFWRFLLFVLKYIYRQSDEDLHARVVKLVYTYALGAYAFRRAGSSPVSRTKENLRIFGGFLFIQDYLCGYILRGSASRPRLSS